jgi:nucleoside-diphosphate-sugar epimerase
MFKCVAVLGATGPTGFHLAEALRGRTHALRMVSRNARKLEALFGGRSLERLTADMTRADDVQRVVAGCDVVFDCIGLGGAEMAQHAVTARNIAAAVRSHGARCVHVSSYWAYLPAVELRLNEKHPRRDGGEWVRARRAAEDILQDTGAAVLHLPDFFGPLVHTGVLQQALAEAVAGKPMNWIGRADTVHEYVYVPDAMALAVELAADDRAFGERWVFPGSGPITALQIAEITSGVLGHKAAVRAAGTTMLRLVSLFNPQLRAFMPLVPDYMKPITYDASKLEAVLGKRAMTPYKPAIGQTLGWLRRSAEKDAG